MTTSCRTNRARLIEVMGATVIITGGYACVLETIDLRESEEQSCGWLERRDPSSGKCAPCDVRGEPSSICPCAYEYVAADFPYCDTTDAYFECRPCVGAISDCNLRAYNPAGQTSNDCALLQLCCNQLVQAGPPSQPCCAEGKELNCVSGVESAAVACWDSTQDLADCCPGAPCDGEVGACQPWQTCVDHYCRPGCNRDSQRCEVISADDHLTCDCVPL